jgi:DNA modification methylase
MGRHRTYATNAERQAAYRTRQAQTVLRQMPVIHGEGYSLYQGDALAWLPTQPNVSMALVVTDPPYNTTDYAWDTKGTRQEYLAWMRHWLQALRPTLKPAYHLFVFCDPDYGEAVERLLRMEHWPLKSRLIWEYRNLVKGRTVTDKFIENYQLCFHCGTHALNWAPAWDKRRFMVQEFATPQRNFAEGRHHPTAKPLDLIKHLVQVGSKTGDVVLDPFMGSGTTGVACLELGRRFIGIELDPGYFQIACDRLAQSAAQGHLFAEARPATQAQLL